MVEMFEDGVEAYVLPDDNFCLADEEHRSPLELGKCPLGHDYCSGDCFYYSEEPKDKKEQEDVFRNEDEEDEFE